ncbi:cytochrome P450 family protein [Sorangium cellulosum]|uniref:cytochrome P450 family protein n=1 Tax=Sorangium cellulosum TaxID=56 RepID=UPI0018F8793F|nr:cytochrome P450 [Sorangium cellulosum]
MPKLAPVNLASPDFKPNAYAIYARLRAEEPVHRTALEDGRVLWLVTRYDDCVAALKDERLVKDWRPLGIDLYGPDEARMQLDRHMLNTDPPTHTRLRAIVNKAFTPKLVEGLRDRIQAIADDLLDQVQGRGEMDLVADYAFPLPIIVIAELLGVPVADRHRIRTWSDAVVGGVPTRERVDRAAGLIKEFKDYLLGMVEERRKAPREDLLSALVHVEEEGAGKLDETELLSMVFLLLIAGHETTVNLIANGMLALLTHPAERERLRADPSLLRSAIEELLRYDSPVETATFRFAREDVELGGAVIPKGDAVVVVLGSANRDPALTPSPESLDLAREPNRHIAFGLGIHYCLGAPLARLEGQIAIGTILRRMPNLALKVPPESIEIRPSLLVRGPASLPVSF